jgi:hypothetical protein
MTDTSMAERAGRKSQHGSYRQIPPEARGLPVLSVMRDPFDQYVSAYELRFWQTNPIWDVVTLERTYPGYPDLSFDQYVEMMQDHGVKNLLMGKALGTDVGFLTLRFLKFYGVEPDRMLDSLTDEYIESERFRSDLAPVRFVHTESLVPDLRDFLAEVGFGRDRTEFMMHLPRVNAAEARRGKPWQEYFTPEIRERVRHAERMLFRLFPRYDVTSQSGS